MVRIHLIDYVIDGKDGNYRAFSKEGGPHQAPFDFRVNLKPLPPHGHLVVERIFAPDNHIAVASAKDIKEANSLAYDALVEGLAYTVRNSLYDVQHKGSDLAICILPVEDRTVHNDTLDKFFTHLRDFSDELDVSKDLFEMYEKAALERVAQVTQA